MQYSQNHPLEGPGRPCEEGSPEKCDCDWCTCQECGTKLKEQKLRGEKIHMRCPKCDPVRNEYIQDEGSENCMGTLKPVCPTCGKVDFWEGGTRATIKADAKRLTIYEAQCGFCGEDHEIREYKMPVYYTEGLAT